MKHSVRIQETDRTVEIKDGEDNLKYLATLEKGVDEELQTVFIVKIIKYNGLDEESETMFDESYDTIEAANFNFKRMVENYVFLIKAESKPIDDIKLYADRIEYHHIDTDCCLNCEFSAERPDRLRPFKPGHIPFKPTSLFCENPDNFVIFRNTINYDTGMDFRGNNTCSFDCHGDCRAAHPDCLIGNEYDACDHIGHSFVQNRRKRAFGPADSMFLAHPKVDFNGICKNYKRRIKPRPEPRPRPVV